MKNSKFYVFLLFLGVVFASYNYWGDFVKTNIFDSVAPVEEEIDYSWLNTYQENNKKVLRKLPESDVSVIPYETKEVNFNHLLDEKERFVDSVYKSSCLVFSANSNFTKELEALSVKIFEDAGFTPNNKESMDLLIDKYKDDDDYIKAVLSASVDCKCKDGYELSKVDFKCVLP